MDRRSSIRLLAMGAAGLWTANQLDGPFLLDAQAPPQAEPLLPLFPLDLVLLPQTNLPLHIFEERYKEMIQDCLQNHWEFGMLAVQGDTAKSIGCTASISEVVTRFPDGRLNILVRGQRRFEVTDVNEDKSYLRGKVEFLDDETDESAAEDIRMRAIQLYDRVMVLADPPARQFQDAPSHTNSQLSYRLMAAAPADLDFKQSLLQLRSERERLDRVIQYFEKLIDYLEKSPEGPRAAPRDVASLF
jgi:ATP-dependent Lon protease